MINTLSIRIKFLVPVAAVFLVLLAVAGVALQGQRMAGAHLRHQLEVRENTVELSLALKAQTVALVSRLYQTLTWEAVGFEASEIRAIDASIKTEIASLLAGLGKRLDEPSLTDGERALIGQMLEEMKRFQQATQDTIEMKSSAQGLGLAAMSLSGASAAANKMLSQLQALERLTRERADAEMASAHADMKRAGTITAGLVLAALAAGGILAWFGQRSLMKPVAELQQALGTLASGDLRHPLRTAHGDEIGQLIRAAEDLRQRLHQILGDVAQASTQVTNASGEIADGTQDLSNRTEQQACALQQTAASMSQMSTAVSTNVQAAQAAGVIAGKATDVAAQGKAAVGRVVETMMEISTQSKRIVEIIGTIDGIAFQTNILALNAAVEAARAGEQGRGFGVVATEVRSLAHRSATAAKEIKALISTSVEQAERGAALVHEAGTTIQAMVGEVEQVTQTIREIAEATSSQSEGIAQVTQAVSQIDQMTQQNAALVEESSASAASLRAQAGRLSSALAVFKLEHA